MVRVVTPSLCNIIVFAYSTTVAMVTENVVLTSVSATPILVESGASSSVKRL